MDIARFVVRGAAHKRAGEVARNSGGGILGAYWGFRQRGHTRHVVAAASQSCLRDGAPERVLRSPNFSPWFGSIGWPPVSPEAGALGLSQTASIELELGSAPPAARPSATERATFPPASGSLRNRIRHTESGCTRRCWSATAREESTLRLRCRGNEIAANAGCKRNAGARDRRRRARRGPRLISSPSNSRATGPMAGRKSGS